MNKIRLSFICAVALAGSAFTIVGTDVIGTLREKINAYNSQFKRAKLDLFFNQPKYFPGDTAFFRTLYVTAADMKGVPGRNIINVTITDASGKIALQEQVLTNDGVGRNQITLPDSLPAGIYKLVAYTEWMRNIDPSQFYQRKFVVSSKELLTDKKTDDLTAGIFPEGGTLVRGVENNIVIKGPSSTSFSVQDGTSAVIAQGNFDGAGLAEIKLTPQSGIKYAVVVGDRKTPFPNEPAEGFAIFQTGDASGKIQIQVAASPAVPSGKYVAVVSGATGIVYSKEFEATEASPLTITLPEKTKAGVWQFAVVNEQTEVVAQRVLYVPVMGESPEINVSTTKPGYATREKVSASFSITEKDGSPIAGRFSVRVINDDLLPTGDDDHSADNLLLWSDLAYGSHASLTDKTSLNRLLITEAPAWLSWKKILTDAAPKYKPEKYLTFDGRAVDGDAKPVPDSTVIMFFLQKQVLGYQVQTTHDGRFSCPLVYDFWDSDELFYAASYKGQDIHNVTITFDKEVNPYTFKADVFSKTSTQDPYALFSARRKIIDKSFNYYSKSAETLASLNPNAAIEEELNGADVTVNLSDYVVFPTMTDMLREVVPSVDRRTYKGVDVIRVYTSHRYPTKNAEPLYVIDGILTKNTKLFLSLKPADLVSIKVVRDGNKLSRFGAMGNNGIIIVRTKFIDAKEKISRESTLSVKGLAHNAKAIGKSAVRDSAPDLRACLYWNPDVLLDASGKASFEFVTSDDAGRFKIQIEGITADGRPFFAERAIDVRFAGVRP